MSSWIYSFRCECGKLHCAAGVSEISVCSCERKLYGQMVRA